MIRFSFLATMSCTALLAGCALGPNYKPPTPPAGANAAFISTGPATTSADAPDNWWQLYNDPVLNGLITQAFAANADLKTAEANLVASRAILEGTRDAFYAPQTNTGAAATYGRNATTNEILELGGHKSKTVWQFDAMLDASYELDLFGHVRRSIEAARDNTEAVAAARDDLRITIAAETARAYGEICTLGEQISVAQRSVALAAQQLQIVQQRYDAGAGSHFDVLRQTVLVDETRATLPPLQGQRQAALFELTALLGETPANAPVSVEACVTPPSLTSPMPVGDGAAMLRRRPDVREADRKLAASLAQVGVATADLFPRVTLNGFWGGAGDQINMLGSNNALTWGIGPAISWSFPNMSGPLANLAQAKAANQAAIDSFDAVVLQALKETEQALSLYAAELNHHGALAAAQGAAGQAFAQAQDQYNAGQISTLDLLASEQTVITADTSLAASDAALVQDQIAVFKSLGGGWQ